MFTVGIPAYNRWSLVADAFVDVLNDERVSEIVIVDDASDIINFEKLSKVINNLNSEKIKLFRNTENKKAFLNKLEVVEKSSNDWVILLDSDNKIGIDYLNSIPLNLDQNIFYIPSLTQGSHSSMDYTKHNNVVFEKDAYIKLLTQDLSQENACMLNAGNFLVNKHTYIQSIRSEQNLIDPYGTDPFYQIFLGFKNIDGFKVKVVEGMKYHHRLHNGFNGGEAGSWWVQTAEKSLEVFENLKRKAGTI